MNPYTNQNTYDSKAPLVGGSSSGRTTDSDSVYRGSNPRPPANAQCVTIAMLESIVGQVFPAAASLVLAAISSLILPDFLKSYFRLLDRIFNLAFPSSKTSKLLKLFEEPHTSVDERIAKIDEAKRNLTEGLEAIDELRKEAEQNKLELKQALKSIEETQEKHAVAKKELESIRKISDADISTLRKVAGIPSVAQIWRERFYGFISGVLASLLATWLWQFIQGIIH